MASEKKTLYKLSAKGDFAAKFTQMGYRAIYTPSTDLTLVEVKAYSKRDARRIINLVIVSRTR
jgi:hypothetical protein